MHSYHVWWIICSVLLGIICVQQRVLRENYIRLRYLRFALFHADEDIPVCIVEDCLDGTFLLKARLALASKEKEAEV